MINKAILVGRVGTNPETKALSSGTTVCKFTLATSEKYRDKNGQSQEKTEWHTVVAWGKLAEICGQYLTKGRQVFVEGSINYRSYDGQDGQKRYVTEIKASDVKFLGRNNDESENPF